jgi:hypothetical protein
MTLYNDNEKMNVLKYVAYNNYDKLNENKQYIPSKFKNLFIGSIKHHSKECFDIIITDNNICKFLNRHYHSISCVFQNYIMAPNENNKYYVDKILPLLSIISYNSMIYIVQDMYLFQNIFNMIEKDEDTFIYLLEIIITKDNVKSFKHIYNYLVNGNYLFFNDNWINKNILLQCMINDSINILKELESIGKDITNIIVNNKNLSSLIVSLTHIFYYNYSNKMPVKCFDYLLTNINQNLLWIVIIRPLHGCEREYFKLENMPCENIMPISDDYMPNNIMDLDELGVFTDTNLSNYILNHIDDIDYMILQITRLLDFMISKEANDIIKDQLQKIILIPNLNLIERITKDIFNMIETIAVSKKICKGRRGTKIVAKKIKKINISMNIILYYKTKFPQLVQYNPLQEDNININSKSKTLLKQTILDFIDMKFNISDSFKTNVLEKLFSNNIIKKFSKKNL